MPNLQEEGVIPYEFTEHPSHSLGRPDSTHTNNYLEPEAVGHSIRNIEALRTGDLNQERVNAYQSSVENEIVQFHEHSVAIDTVHNNGNVYQEQNINPHTSETGFENKTKLQSKIITKAVDVPPPDNAPCLKNSR